MIGGVVIVILSSPLGLKKSGLWGNPRLKHLICNYILIVLSACDGSFAGFASVTTIPGIHLNG